MSLRLAYKFANYLSKGDVRRLFYDVLVKKYKSIKKASEVAGIERKTVYNWKTVKDVNIKTKIKVLKAAYEENPLYTLSFLAKVLRRRTGEALFTLIDYIKTEALKCEDKEKFLELVKFLESALNELGAPLKYEISTEISDVKQVLAQKALKLGIELWKIWPEYYSLIWSYSPLFEEYVSELSCITAGTLVYSPYPTVPTHSKGELSSTPEEAEISSFIVCKVR